MDALNLSTPMFNHPTTFVAAVRTSSSRPAPSHLPDNMPKGESLVQSSSSLRNQQGVQHFQTQTHNEKLEYELMKQASLKDFEKEAFLRRLRNLRDLLEVITNTIEKF